jgi:hypothetical protein
MLTKSKSSLVIESPVRSGFLTSGAMTVTVTGHEKFKEAKKPDRTDQDRSRAVFCGYKTGFDRFRF